MNKAEARKFVQSLDAYPNQRAAASALGVAQSTISARLTLARKVLDDDQPKAHKTSVPATRASVRGGVARTGRAGRGASTPSMNIAGAPELPAVTEEKLLRDELRQMQSQVKSLSEQALTDEKVRRHIFEIAHSKPTMPEWLSAPASASHADSLPGVPVLFGSDWHWGEVVNPAEIGGVNEYNLEIAHARLTALIETSIDLLTNHMVNPTYPGIVFALGGDMVSGNIHEELSETNDAPIMPVVLDLVDHLYLAIVRLKEVFGRVFLPCVAGNHGRSTKKIRAKEFNFNSYDWLIYQCLDRRFADDPDVIFYIPDGTDALVKIAGHTYCFSHGCQFRGGDGLIGPLGPIVRGDHKKRGRNSQVGQAYDTLVIGHFHQLMQMKRIIVNGSLVGYSEYAYSNNFGYEPPQQALWVSHPRRGITFSMPVNVGTDFSKRERDAETQPWVAFQEAKKPALK